jgi:hypothetical protein
MNTALCSLPNEKAKYSEAEAYLAILMLAASCDAQRLRPRMDALQAWLWRSPLLAPFGEKGRLALDYAVVQLIERDGQEALDLACAALPEAMRPSVFAQAADIIGAAPSSLIDPQFLAKLQDRLGLSSETAARILSVVALKNAY